MNLDKITNSSAQFRKKGCHRLARQNVLHFKSLLLRFQNLLFECYL